MVCVIPLQTRSVKGLQAKNLWFLGKKKPKKTKKLLQITMDKRHGWLPTGVTKQSTRMPMGEMGDVQMDRHPGWDELPSSPSQKGRIQGSPGLSPEVIVRTGLQPSHHHANHEHAELLLSFREREKGREAEDGIFHFRAICSCCARLAAQDEASLGSEREGRNVGLCSKGTFVQPRRASQDCL